MKQTWVGAWIGVMLLAAGPVRATTPNTITVDGDLGDFASDEKTAGDAVGDSVYGANNDLGELHITWDTQYLYLGFGYNAWGSGVMYLVDTGVAGGVTSLCPNAGYTGAFPANVQGGGFNLMVALFAPDGPTTSAAYVYALAGTGSTDISSATGVAVQLQESVDTGTPVHAGVVEARIPWDTLYGLGPGKVPAGAALQLAGALRGKLDGDGLGDVSPDQAGAVTQGNCWSGSGNSLTTLHQVTVDGDGDGAPDPGWSPGSNGPKADAGVPVDSAVPDTTPAPDTQAAPDAAPVADLVAPADQATPPADAGAVDAPAADVGSAQDSSVAVDAGGGDRQEEGCACSAKGSSATAGPLALVLLGLVLGRRRRDE